MYKIASLLAPACLMAIGLAAQTQKDPTVTELYEPKAKVVTPGRLPADAPSDAIILFDGKDLNQWASMDGSPAKWEVKDGVFTVSKKGGDIKTKLSFGDFQLHIEWRTATGDPDNGQNKSNSGIFLQDRYELQVLDNYENETYSNGQAGSIYKQHIPLANASRKPGEWQTYDVIYTAPRFGETGRLIEAARVTVLHNGVLVQNNVSIWGPTEYIGLGTYQSHGKAPLRLQDHDNPVSFRNIWIREL